jgi:hypothetical protein
LARRRRRYGVGFVAQVRGAASYISIEVGRSLTGAASAAEASSATRHACSLRGAAWAGGQAKPLLNSRSLVTSSVSFSIINFCLDEKLVPPAALLVTEGQGLIAPFFGWRVHARMRIATPNLTRFNHIFTENRRRRRQKAVLRCRPGEVVPLLGSSGPSKATLLASGSSNPLPQCRVASPFPCPLRARGSQFATGSQYQRLGLKNNQKKSNRRPRDQVAHRRGRRGRMARPRQ